jgi:hypothetical protein
MKRMALLLALAALLVAALPAPGLTTGPLPSTNDYNQANDLPHVESTASTARCSTVGHPISILLGDENDWFFDWTAFEVKSKP